MTTPPADPATAARRPRRTFRWLVPLLSLLVAGIAFEGSLKWPTPAAEGAAFNAPAGARPSAADKLPLRLGTYNIAGGMGLDGKRDISRAGNYIKDCDLISLNEVHGAAVPGSADNQAHVLGETLHLPWLFAPVERRWWHDDFGNAALSSLPVEHWQRVPLSDKSSKSHRNMLLLDVRWQQRPLHVLITHVERGPDRPNQLRRVLQRFLAMPVPAILMGDLNTTHDDPQLRELTATPGVVDAIAQAPNAAPDAKGRIDWILLRGPHPVGVSIQAPGVSDHPFYQIDITP